MGAFALLSWMCHAETDTEHPQRSGFFVPFCQIVQYVLYRMLTYIGGRLLLSRRYHNIDANQIQQVFHLHTWENQ